jgi:hypothetical protein
LTLFLSLSLDGPADASEERAAGGIALFVDDAGDGGRDYHVA